MKFETQIISPGPHGPDPSLPFCLQMTVSHESWGPPRGKEKIFIIDVAAEHLQTFSAFQEHVAKTFCIWLSPPTNGNWDSQISSAFEAGRQLQEKGDDDLSLERLRREVDHDDSFLDRYNRMVQDDHADRRDRDLAAVRGILNKKRPAR